MLIWPYFPQARMTPFFYLERREGFRRAEEMKGCIFGELRTLDVKTNLRLLMPKHQMAYRAAYRTPAYRTLAYMAYRIPADGARLRS